MNHFPHFDGDSLVNRLFGDPRKKAGGRPFIGGHRKKPASEAAAEPESSEEDPVEPSNYVEKAEEQPKVVLKNLAWVVDKASFNDKVKVQLEAEVPKPHAHLTRIEIKVLALTPDGKKEPIDKQETHLKDGAAEGEVTVFYPQYREDGNLLSQCKYVFTAKHRESDETESGPLQVKQPFVSKVRWEKAEEWFGVPVKLLADTCLKDGEEVTVKVASENGVALETKAKAKKGKLEIPWTPCLCGVAQDAEGKYPDKVEYFAEISKGEEKAVPEKNFLLKVIGQTRYSQFSKDCTWGIFSTYAEFEQRVFQGELDIRVERPIMKAWPAYMLDLRTAGMKGPVAGNPYHGWRWGRITDNGEHPNQYHDGKQWQPLPKGFRLDEDFITVVGLIRQGGKFVEGGEPSAVFPDQFEDYDFDSAEYLKKRKAWKSDTDTRWSRKFLVRPAACQKGHGPGGCGYPLDLQFIMTKVETWRKHTIAVCNGAFRSNSGCFSLEDDDIQMAAHEVGHLVGMPDEYKGGGIDPSINGDGAVKGIDRTTIMGNSMDKVKRRHYANFVAMAQSQVTEQVGKKVLFIASDP